MAILTLDEFLKKKKKKDEDIAPVKNGILTMDEFMQRKGVNLAAMPSQEELLAPSGGGAGRSFGTKEEEEKKSLLGDLEFVKKDTLFSDGYQAGDVLKSVGANFGKMGVGLLKGSMGLAEGITDALLYGASGVTGLFGADELSEQIKNEAKASVVDNLFKPADELLDKYSTFGSTTDAINQGVGQVATLLAGGALAKGAGMTAEGISALTQGTMGVSAFGSGMSEAYEGGATDKEAVTYGTVRGASAVVTEMLFGGLGKSINAVGFNTGLSQADDMLAQKVTSKITNLLAKNTASFGIKAGAEGTEELLDGFVGIAAKKLTYMSEEDIKKIIEDENLLEQFVVGTFTSGVMQSGIVPGTQKGSLIETTKAGRDFITGYTQNEQKVIDKEIENRIAEKEADGTQVDKKERANIAEQVRKDLEKGNISIDTIESTLGGDTFTAYNNLLKEAEEYTTLNRTESGKLTGEQSDRLAKLKEKNKAKAYEAEISELKSKLSQEVDQLTGKDTFLRESYNEKARRSQAFEADLTQYDAKQQAIVQKAAESGILNNTRRTHEFVDMVAKISADKGVLFDFTNNEKLNESGFALEGKTVNGFVKDGNITLNINSAKALNTVVGHEITHVLESTELYTELQQVVKEYATTRGEYDTRLQELTKLYESVEGVNVENELTADLVGEYLFTDSDFINRLSTEKPNIFKKIYEEIKYLVKTVTGSKEARELENVKRAFDKAYKESSVNMKANDVNFSLVGNENGIEVYETSEATKELSYKERKQKLLDTMKNEFAGRTAKFAKNGEVYYAFYDKDGLNKGVYGDKKSDKKGYKTKINIGADGNYIELAENALYVDSSKESGKTNRFHKDAKEWDYYVKTVKSDGVYYDVLVNVKNTGDNQFVYDITLKEAVSLPDTENVSYAGNSTASMNSIPQNTKNSSGDVKYSLSEDSQGNTLSQEQKEYFKDSKVVDDKGNLKVVYHGSTADFNTFSLKYLGTNGTNEGYGFYFTDRKHIAQSYANGTEAQRHEGANGKLFEVYLDIKKPLSDTEVTMSRSDFRKFLVELNNQVDEDGEPLDVLSNYGDVSWEGLNKVINYAMEIEYDGSDSDVNMVHSIINGVGNMETVFKVLRKTTGYDGIIIQDAEWGGDQTIYVAFHPEQIKNADNLNPTSNPDTRYSISNEREQIAPVGNYNVYGKDIALEQEIAPVQETVSKKEIVDDYTPLSEEMASERDAQQLPIDESYAPAETEDIYEDLDDIFASDNTEVADPFNERDIKDVGNRKVKAYMYENPEVKPYFQEEAQNMLYELRNSVKGEKHFNDQLYYESSGEQGWFGTRRETSEDIAYLLDNFKYTYADIEKGLNAIIEDHGAENNAISKRIEFALNDRLKDGYTDFMSGMQIPANQDYVNLLTEKQIAAYSDEAYAQWAESLAGVEPTEDIAPVAEAEAPAEDIAPVMDGVQRKIDLETGEVIDEAVSDLDKARQRIMKKLTADKQKALSDFREKQARAFAELGERESYISNKALELYSELRDLKKGIRASNELSYLLDFGYPWKDIKTALLNAHAKPANVVNENSGIEAIVREAIGREYDTKYEDIAYMNQNYLEESKQLEAEAQKAIEALESGEGRKTHGEIQRAYVEGIKQKFSEAGYDFDKVLESAKDKSTFASVDNTPQRYIEKTFGYKEGQILNDMTINQEAQHETQGIKWLNSFTSRKDGELAKLSKKYGIKPNSKEDAAAQMYAEGFYIDGNNQYVRYGDAELAADFPDADTQERIKGLVNNPRIREIYDTTLQQINESRVRNGYPEIPRRDNYYLHFRAMDDTFSKLGIPFNPNDIRAKDLPTDINGMTADLKPGQPYFASANARRGQKTSHSLIGGMERYLTSAKNQIYHIDDIQTLRGLRNYVADMYGQAHGLENLDSLTEEEAEARVKEVYDAHLSTFAKFLNEQANVLAGKTALVDRGLEGVIGRRGITFLDTVNRQVGSNMVGFNVSSSLTNFVGVVQAFAKSNKYDAIKAFSQLVSNRIGSIYGKTDGFAENNPAIIRRKGVEKLYRTPFEKITDAGYMLMSAVDSVSTEFITRAKYNELTRKGMDPQKAHYESDKWASRILGDRSLGQQPQLYNSKMLGLFTKFQLEVRNQLDSQFYDTIQEAKVSTEDIQNGLERNAKKAAKVASTFLQLAVMQHLFGKAFESVAGYNPTFDIIGVLLKTFGFDDDEESEDTPLDNLEQGFLELLGDLPYTSAFTGGRIPIASALPIEQLITGKDDYGNEKDRFETLAETAPYYILPGGYGQIKKTTQGLGMFDEDLPVSGSYTDSGNLRFPVEDTPLNRAQAALFGQWASGNSRDYFDNERQPLKEKQIQEYKDLDIPIKDYWKYRDGLKEQDTLEEKFDYIAGLDLPVSKKNIMINNIVDRKEDVDLEGYDDFEDYEEFDFSVKNPEKYAFLQAYNISYKEYAASEASRDAYNWAYNNPGKYPVAKAVAGDVVTYREYAKELDKIEADKDGNGKTINGSRKEKVISYINNLDADYGARIILYKNEYPSDDTYNEEIVEYLNNRDNITSSEMVIILQELGYTVEADGTVRW